MAWLHHLISKSKTTCSKEMKYFTHINQVKTCIYQQRIWRPLSVQVQPYKVSETNIPVKSNSAKTSTVSITRFMYNM